MSTEETSQKVALVDALTPRQKEALAGIASGESRKDLAARLAISPRTLHQHLNSVYTRLNIHSAPEAVRVAMAAKLV